MIYKEYKEEKKKNTSSIEYVANGLLKKNKQTMKRTMKSRRWREEAKETWKLIVKL
jgi:hypothetical protein